MVAQILYTKQASCVAKYKSKSKTRAKLEEPVCRSGLWAVKTRAAEPEPGAPELAIFGGDEAGVGAAFKNDLELEQELFLKFSWSRSWWLI